MNSLPFLNGKFIFSYTEEQDKTNEYLYLIYRNENGGLNLVGLDFENFLINIGKIPISQKVVNTYLKMLIKQLSGLMSLIRDLMSIAIPSPITSLRI